MKMKIINDQVVYSDDPIVKIQAQDLDLLQKKMNEHGSDRIRLCAHKGVEDSIHEMVIVHTKETYVPPHKHINKIESFHVVKGEADIVIFDDSGEIKEIMEVGEFSSGRIFYYRLSEPLFHTLIIRSDVIIFHEVTNGPFEKADSVFPEWAPEASQTQEVRQYMDDLNEEIKLFRN